LAIGCPGTLDIKAALGGGPAVGAATIYS